MTILASFPYVVNAIVPRHSTMLTFTDAIIHKSDPTLSLPTIKENTARKMAPIHYVQSMQSFGLPFLAPYA
jgi:hypothetical protein